MRRTIAQEGPVAVRLLTAGGGAVQPRLVEKYRSILEAEVADGAFTPSAPLDELAYALTRVTEACVYLDLLVGQQPDLDRVARMIRAVINRCSPGCTGGGCSKAPASSAPAGRFGAPVPLRRLRRRAWQPHWDAWARTIAAEWTAGRTAGAVASIWSTRSPGWRPVRRWSSPSSGCGSPRPDGMSVSCSPTSTG
jgi:hypothetical protein